MPDTLDPATAADAVSWVNVKNLGDMTALSAGLSSQDAVALQRRTNDLALQLHESASHQAQQLAADAAAFRTALLARATQMLMGDTALQASASSQEMTGNLQQKLAEIGASLASVQDSVKASITTPPQTGTGGAFGSDAGSALLQQIVNAQAAQSQVLASLASALAGIQSFLQGFHPAVAAPAAPKV